MIAPLTVAYARQEADTLHGCIGILGSLRKEIETTAPGQSEGGTMLSWAHVIKVVIGALDQAADNLDGAVEIDEAPAMPGEAAAEAEA